MQSVALYIMDVVKTIDAAGYAAKGQKGPKSLYEIFLVQQVVAEEQWGEHKCVLKPLQGAQKHLLILVIFQQQLDNLQTFYLQLHLRSIGKRHFSSQT